MSHKRNSEQQNQQQADHRKPVENAPGNEDKKLGGPNRPST
ncbi:hypothetical protein [Sutcliffiella halmapala]|nr:hypothetical protein [Sutcliffiella halmapala]